MITHTPKPVLTRPCFETLEQRPPPRSSCNISQTIFLYEPTLKFTGILLHQITIYLILSGFGQVQFLQKARNIRVARMCESHLIDNMD